MIIGIDASAFLTQQASGVEITTCDLIGTILEQDTSNTYWLYSATPIQANLPWSERVKNVVVPGNYLWTQRHLSRAIKANPPDIFWSPSNILPMTPKKTKRVATIHDLAWHILGKNYSFKQRIYSMLSVKRAIGQADKLIAVSQQTKRDLKKYFNVPGENIEVVYHALRQGFQPSNLILAEKFPELDKYVLCVGRIEDRKNLQNLVKAWAKFHPTHPDIKLALVGWPVDRQYYKNLLKLIKKLKLGGSVLLMNYVDQKYLPDLYQSSLGLVFPTKYEGFGMPILEGFASGIPVLTSNIGATREIADGAAVLVDPYNVDEILRGITQIIEDPDLRQSLIAKGAHRLKDFSWEASAQKMINLWKTL